MNAEDVVQAVTAGPAWCLNLAVIPAASRRSPGFANFLKGESSLRVTYTDLEAGGRNHVVAKPREIVVIKDSQAGVLGAEGVVVGLGTITANYHNPENPFLKIHLQKWIDPGLETAEFRHVPGGEALYETLLKPVLFEIIE